MANIVKSRSLVATITEQSVDVNQYKLKTISNDNETSGDLLISLDAPFATAVDVITLKPGEVLTFEADDEEVICGVLYYKSSTGSVNGRVLALRY